MQHPYFDPVREEVESERKAKKNAHPSPEEVGGCALISCRFCYSSYMVFMTN